MINVNKCKLSPAQMKDAKMGMRFEMEHTNNKKEALKIAMQHECEFKGKLYYANGLIPMERKLRRMK
jgi:hypothetical protein